MTIKAQLDEFIDRFDPEIAKRARALLKKMRARLPGTTELIYDSHNALVIGFASSDRASDAIFSIALYPRWINLFFAHGATLPDPKKLLKGSGKQVRHIRIDDAAQLDDPPIVALMKTALARCEPFDPGTPRQTILKAIAPNPRPRRP